MSDVQQIKLQCFHCDAPGRFEAPAKLVAQLDKANKEKLIEGTLFDYTCPQCGKHTPAYPDSFLYHDMDTKWLVHLSPKGEEPFDGGPIPEEFADHRCRKVKSRDALVEKIRIMEDGLDDRLVEIFKVFTWLKLPEHSAPPLEELSFRGLVNVQGEPSIGVGTGAGNVAVVGYELMKLTEDNYAQPPAKLGVWKLIDHNAGTALMQEGNARMKAEGGNQGTSSSSTSSSYSSGSSSAKTPKKSSGNFGCAVGVLCLIALSAAAAYLLYLEEGVPFGKPTKNVVAKKKIKPNKPFKFGYLWNGVNYAHHDVWLVVEGDRDGGQYAIKGDISCSRSDNASFPKKFEKDISNYDVVRVKEKGTKKFSAWIRIKDEYSRASTRPWTCKGDFSTVTGKTKKARIVVTQHQRPSDFIAF